MNGPYRVAVTRNEPSGRTTHYHVPNAVELGGAVRRNAEHLDIAAIEISPCDVEEYKRASQREDTSAAHKMRWTITRPDGSAFDAVIDHVYEAEMGMNQLLEAAGWEAYAHYEEHGPPLVAHGE